MLGSSSNVYNVKRVLRALTTSIWKYTAATALIAAIGFLFPSLWFLSVFGGSGFLYTVWKYGPNIRESLLLGFLWGAVTSGASIWWFWSVLPLNWTGVGGIASFALVGITWSAGTLALSLPFVVFAPLFVLLRRFPAAPLAVGVIWWGLEEARMWSFALLVLSSQSTLQPYFSIGAFGNLLAEQSLLLQLASLGGVHVLNAIFGICIGSIAWFFYRQEARAKFVSIACLVGVLYAGVSLSYMQTPGTETAVAGLVTLAVPPSNQRDSLPLLQALAQLKNGPHADIVVLPEGYEVTASQNDAEAYQRVFGSQESLIIESGFTQTGAGTGYGTLSYLSTTRGIIGTHEKTLLVPVGEYMPPILNIFFKLADARSLNQYVDAHFSKKTERGTSVETASLGTLRVGALLCSEILSPDLYHTLSTGGADVLINVANNAWFHESHLVYRKLLELSKIHAVENRRYFLVASNDSPSFAINPQGEVVAQTTWGYTGILYVTVGIPSPKNEMVH